MKIIVAEDEPRQREGIVRILQSIDSKLECIAFGDGTEVIEYLDHIRYEADILLTDINMPDLGGLELVQHLGRHRKNLLVILLSGYASFEYAQQAVQLGAFRYLLKPIDPAEMEAVLAEARKKLGASRPAAQPGQDPEWERQTGNGALLERQLNRWINGWLPQEDREKLLPIFHSGGPGFLILSRFWLELEAKEQRDGLQMMLIQDMRELLARQYRCYSFFLESAGLEMVTVVLQRPGSAGGEVGDRLARWQGQLEELHGIRSHCFIGDRNSDLMADIARQYGLDRKRQIYTLFVGPAVRGRASSPPEYVPLLVEAVKARNREAAVDLLCGLALERGESISTIKEGVGAVCGQVCLGLSDQAELVALHGQQLRERIRESESLAELAADAYDCLEELWALCAGGKMDQQKLFSLRISDYIRRNYEKDIALEDAARYFRLNPSYFSTMVKAQNGCGFQTLLTNTRLAKACQLLCKTDLKIQEVAVLVGYQDASYFSRIFKKNLAQTPEQYRKGMGGAL